MLKVDVKSHKRKQNTKYGTREVLVKKSKRKIDKGKLLRNIAVGGLAVGGLGILGVKGYKKLGKNYKKILENSSSVVKKASNIDLTPKGKNLDNFSVFIGRSSKLEKETGTKAVKYLRDNIKYKGDIFDYLDNRKKREIYPIFSALKKEVPSVSIDAANSIYNLHKKYPDKTINLIGHSVGGSRIEEVATILKSIEDFDNSKLSILTLGSGTTKLLPDSLSNLKQKHIVDSYDNLAKQTIDFPNTLKEGRGQKTTDLLKNHSMYSYTKNYKKEIRDYLNIDIKAKQKKVKVKGSNKKQDLINKLNKIKTNNKIPPEIKEKRIKDLTDQISNLKAMTTISEFKRGKDKRKRKKRKKAMKKPTLEGHITKGAAYGAGLGALYGAGVGGAYGTAIAPGVGTAIGAGVGSVQGAIGGSSTGVLMSLPTYAVNKHKYAHEKTIKYKNKGKGR